MEHIERAGVHSGDSACCIPPFSLDKKIIAQIEQQTSILAQALQVKGLMNIQFAVQTETYMFWKLTLELKDNSFCI